MVERHRAGDRLPREPERRSAELAGRALLRLGLGQGVQGGAQTRQGGRMACQDVAGGSVHDGDGHVVRAELLEQRCEPGGARTGDRDHRGAGVLVARQRGGDGRVGHRPAVPGGVRAHHRGDPGGVGRDPDRYQPVVAPRGGDHRREQSGAVAGRPRRGCRGGRAQTVGIKAGQRGQVGQEVADQGVGAGRGHRAHGRVGAGGQQVREPVGEQPERSHGRGPGPLVEVGDHAVDPAGDVRAAHRRPGEHLGPLGVDAREEQGGRLRSGSEPGGQAAGQRGRGSGGSVRLWWSSSSLSSRCAVCPRPTRIYMSKPSCLATMIRTPGPLGQSISGPPGGPRRARRRDRRWRRGSRSVAV